MIAAQLTKYGGKSSVSIREDVKMPVLKSGEVLVEVRSAGINPFDYKLRDGSYKDWIRLELPATLGGDVAGVVSELGDDVEGYAVGDEVYGMANAAGGEGSLAECTAVKVSQLADKPKNLDWLQAGALPLAGISAYQALVDEINLQAGERILIHGGAGGIGSFAVQIAKHLGAEVATTVSARDIEFAKSLGADKVIDYKNDDFTKMLSGYDAVFDTVGGETAHKSYSVLSKGGRLVSMIAEPDVALAKQRSITASMLSAKATHLRLAKLADLVDTGAVNVHIDKVFKLNDAATALEYLKTSHPRGKVVIQV